ncbi:MAG: prepilin peptidase [Gammaproteobacteria bacterium]|nr:prepilin peptidase [Gammaproteobacteria bacterium]
MSTLQSLQLLAELNPALLVITTTILGLVVGSFLNVVIHRLPLMMQQGWQQECHELLHPEAAEPPATAAPLTLYHPPSHCPQCKSEIRPLQNIPLVSFLLQRGRCRSCGAAISWRYPLVELLSALLSGIVTLHFGATAALFPALLLTWILLALTFIDLQTQLLPDSITLPGIWLGLLLALFHIFTDPATAIIGAAAGYLSFWSVYQLFKIITGKEGMGYGDFKLLALLGAWFGWQLLPLIIMLSAMLGTLIGITLIITRGHDRQIPIPFGPYLAIAGWVAMLWGESLTATYLKIIV